MAFNNKKKNANYISARESRAIARENRKITQEIEKKRNRKHIPEEEYVTKMKNPENCVEFDNVQTYFFTDIGTVKSVGLDTNGLSLTAVIDPAVDIPNISDVLVIKYFKGQSTGQPEAAEEGGEAE